MSAFVAAIGVVRSQLSPGGFLPSRRLIEWFGLTAGTAGIAAVVSVFLLVPRPSTDEKPLPTGLPPFQKTRRFQYREADDDAETCLCFNGAAIRRTEWRLQRFRRLNVLGVVAVLVWLTSRLVAFGG